MISEKSHLLSPRTALSCVQELTRHTLRVMEGESSGASGAVWKRVGPYDLFNCIGQGSFASVYRGQHRPTRP